MQLQGELVVAVYHISLHEEYLMSVPVGLTAVRPLVLNVNQWRDLMVGLGRLGLVTAVNHERLLRPNCGPALLSGSAPRS